MFVNEHIDGKNSSIEMNQTFGMPSDVKENFSTGKNNNDSFVFLQ
jgi:hypothetical protein